MSVTHVGALVFMSWNVGGLEVLASLYVLECRGRAKILGSLRLEMSVTFFIAFRLYT